jgi:CMP-N-acetylneuraminic acid synthetase
MTSDEFSDIAVLIPAVKKNVAFPNDLVKKLAGKSLIQRTIDKAVTAFGARSIWVVTDSEEIRQTSERCAVRCFYDPNLKIDEASYLESLVVYLRELALEWRHLMVLSPYVPMIDVNQLHAAYEHFREVDAKMLVPVSRSYQHFFSPWPRSLSQVMCKGKLHEITSESSAFSILSGQLFENLGGCEVVPVAHPVEGRLMEISGYEDWWIVEKLLKRRRIVFRVIGDKAVGMGHIYRSLTLAHEISDHEIRFVCDTDSKVAVNKLAGYDYWLGIYTSDKIEQAIVELEPDIVVNDMLDTDAAYVRCLRDAGIRVVNFEDLGSGALDADYTINDLYDEPQFSGDNVLWGHEWFFVRDEFTDAIPRPISLPNSPAQHKVLDTSSLI